MSLIKKGLFIGNFRDAQDITFLNRNGITHILCSAVELYPVFPGRFNYKHIQANDIPSYNLARYFDSGADFINDAIIKGGTVLVHCAAGISRSVSLALAYFLKHEGMPLVSAFNLIKNRRYIAGPNPGFIKQLKDYEARLASARAQKPPTPAIERSKTPIGQQNDQKIGSSSLKQAYFEQKQTASQLPTTSIAPQKLNPPYGIASSANRMGMASTQPMGFRGMNREDLQQQTSFYPSSVPPSDALAGSTLPLPIIPKQSSANQNQNKGMTPQKSQSRLQDYMIKQQAGPQSDIRLNGVGIAKPQAQPLAKPPLLYNDGSIAPAGQRTKSTAPPQGNSELFNRYLRMTVQNTYEPRIVTHNVRGQKVKGSNFYY